MRKYPRSVTLVFAMVLIRFDFDPKNNEQIVLQTYIHRYIGSLNELYFFISEVLSYAEIESYI